ncbi:MAG: hypothetical protein K0S65_3344 [Labilithrix sp.]|nr:hypothetical protein [Labilithrix sp.]
MRSVVLLGVASLLVLTATFACSSATTVTATEEDAGGQLPESSAPTEEEQDPTPPGSSSGDLDSGTSTDGSTEGGTGGSTDGDAGVQCQPGSIRESEANDTEATADALDWKTGSYCGRLSGADVDLLTFTIPSSQNGFQFEMNRTQNGGYKVECSVGGTKFAFDGTYPYVIGTPYFCKVSLTGNAPADYRIQLTVTPN